MKRDTIERTVSTLVTSVFLSLQFWIPLDLITNFMIKMKWEFSFFQDPNKRLAFESSLFAVVVVFISFIGFSIYQLIRPKPIETNFVDFRKEIENLGIYHERYLNSIDKHKALSQQSIPKSDLDFVWVDFILTDIRRAMSVLLAHNSIRVSLFVDQRKAGTYSNSMVFAQSSSFRNHPPRSTQFSMRQGYCGWAWAEGNAVCGSSKKSLLLRRYDKRYFPIPGQEKNMSFLCIPLVAISNSGAKVHPGILCIDSSKSSDLVLNDYMSESICVVLDPLMNILTTHILDGKIYYFRQAAYGDLGRRIVRVSIYFYCGLSLKLSVRVQIQMRRVE